MENGETDNIWSRGWRDTKVGWSDWRFWAFELLLGGGISMIEPVIGIASVIAMAFVVWLCATATAPVRIARDIARDERAKKVAERAKRVVVEKELAALKSQTEGIKYKIRKVFEDANPAILLAIDRGESDIYIKLRPQSAERLLDLTLIPQARHYFCLERYGLVDIGSSGNSCRPGAFAIEDLGFGSEFIHFSCKPTKILRDGKP